MSLNTSTPLSCPVYISSFIDILQPTTKVGKIHWTNKNTNTIPGLDILHVNVHFWQSIPVLLGWPKFWIPIKMWRSVTSQSCPKIQPACLWRQVIVVSLTLGDLFCGGKRYVIEKGVFEEGSNERIQILWKFMGTCNRKVLLNGFDILKLLLLHLLNLASLELHLLKIIGVARSHPFHPRHIDGDTSGSGTSAVLFADLQQHLRNFSERRTKMYFWCFKETNFKITLKLKLKHPWQHTVHVCHRGQSSSTFAASQKEKLSERPWEIPFLPTVQTNNFHTWSDLGRCRFGHTFGRALRAFPVANVGWVGQSTFNDCTTFLFCQNMAANWITMDSVI